MAAEVPSLGEMEMQVLRLVWREEPCTECRITELVQAGRPVVRTTVLKTMQRLEEKGVLVRQAGESGPILYRAAVEEKRVLPKLIRRFVDGVLGGAPGPLAAFLADAGDERLSEKDLATLRAIARKIDRISEKANHGDQKRNKVPHGGLLPRAVESVGCGLGRIHVGDVGSGRDPRGRGVDDLLFSAGPHRHSRHGLWLVVSLKLLIMPFWTWPVTQFAFWTHPVAELPRSAPDNRHIPSGASVGEREVTNLVPDGSKATMEQKLIDLTSAPSPGRSVQTDTGTLMTCTTPHRALSS